MKSILLKTSFQHIKPNKFPAILLIIFIVSFFNVKIYTQQPTQEWIVTYPGPSNDLKGPFLAVDKIGNSYMAGTHVINDTINIAVAKYNTSGALLWSTTYKYPGEGYFAPMAFAIDTLGNAYVTSKYGLSFSTNLNILTVKYSSSNGSVLWAKKYIGRNNSSIGEDIKIDRLNNIYVVGAADSALICIKYNLNGVLHGYEDFNLWEFHMHIPAL